MSFSDFQETLIIIFPAIILILRIVLEVLKDYLDTRDSLAFAEFRKRSSKQIEEKPPDRDIQKELDDILEEAEKMRESLPLVTLWWGLQGLRLNKDGTTEWISRHPVDIPKEDPVTATPSFGYAIGPQIIPTYPLSCTSYTQPYQPMVFWGLDCQNATSDDRISFLEAQEQSLRLTQIQSYQTRAILDSINSILYCNDFEELIDSQEKHAL